MVVVLILMVPMEGILTEVRPATLMEELKQREDIMPFMLVQVVLDQVVMHQVTVAVAVVEVVTMEVERDRIVKVVEEDLLTATGLYVPRQYIQSLLFVVMEWSR